MPYVLLPPKEPHCPRDSSFVVECLEMCSVVRILREPFHRPERIDVGHIDCAISTE